MHKTQICLWLRKMHAPTTAAAAAFLFCLSHAGTVQISSCSIEHSLALCGDGKGQGEGVMLQLEMALVMQRRTR